MGHIGDDDMKKKSGKKPYVRQDSYMRVFLNDEFLTVKKRKNHRKSDGSSVVDEVEN